MRFSKLRLAAIVSVLSLAGCADDDESLIIVGSPQWQDGCIVNVPASVFSAGGVLDVRFETAYHLPLEVQNQLPARSPGTSNTNTDTSEIQLLGVDVTLFSDQRPDLIDALRSENAAFVSFSAPIPTDSVGGNEAKPVIFEAIPAATASRLAALRVAEATAAGEAAVANFSAANPGATDEELAVARLDGQRGVLAQRETFVASVSVRGRRTGSASGSFGELESRSYHFPIEICHGCLITCASCELPIDDDADGTVDRTLTGICPNALVPDDPQQRTSVGNFVGLNFGCTTAQDDFFAPAVMSCGG